MTTIKCPSCNHEFAITDALNDEAKASIQKEKINLRLQMEKYVKAKEEEYKLKEKARDTELEIEKNALLKLAQDKAKETYTLQLTALEQENKDKQIQVNELRQKELDLLRQNREMLDRENNVELEIEKRLLEDRKKTEQTIGQKEQEKYELKMKEKDIANDSLKKTIEELKRKVEQGSMQVQGEAQELLLEELLKDNFIHDTLSEVGKGVEGADCIQTVTTRTGQVCGTIIYESKNAKHWKNEWLAKLKTDKRNKNADLAILVTQVFPKGVTQCTELEGVWVCSFAEVIPVVHLLRSGLMKINEVQKSQEGKGEKMQLLYNFLTGNEFRGQVEATLEGFLSMRNSIAKEKMTMEKIWKEREKQIEKVLLSTSGMFGSIKGIAGSSIADIPLLDGE